LICKLQNLRHKNALPRLTKLALIFENIGFGDCELKENLTPIDWKYCVGFSEI